MNGGKVVWIFRGIIECSMNFYKSQNNYLKIRLILNYTLLYKLNIGNKDLFWSKDDR